VAGDVLTGEVQQKINCRWRTVLTAGGIPVDDRRRTGTSDQGAAALDDIVAELITRYARGWHE